MREIGIGAKTVRQQAWLWLLPIGLSVVSILLAMLGGIVPEVKPGFNVKITLPTGIPSVSDVLQEVQTPLTSSFGLPILLIAIFGLLMHAWLNGGYLGSIFRVLNEEVVTQGTYLQDSNRFFGRMLLSGLLAMLMVIVPTVLAAAMLGPLALLIVVFVMAFIFFWQIAIVKEDLGLEAGLSRGWQVFRDNFSEVLNFVILVILLTAVLSVLLNFLAQSFIGYLVVVVIWSYLGAIFAVAVCELYDSLIRRPSVPPSLT